MNRYSYKNVCLIVTSCMFPKSNVKKLTVTNFETRKEQYMESLKWYINETDIVNICYCDNSMAPCDVDLVMLANSKGKRLEWLSFQGDCEKVAEQGKGYGEGEILDYAFKNSQLVNEADVLIKITGRLNALNIKTILKFTDRRYSYFEMHRGYVDSRCYVVKKQDYLKYLLGLKNEVDDNKRYYIEHVLFDKIKNNTRRFHPLPFALNISGISGSMGVEYKDTAVKHIAKSLKRFILSVIWHITQLAK